MSAHMASFFIMASSFLAIAVLLGHRHVVLAFLHGHSFFIMPSAAIGAERPFPCGWRRRRRRRRRSRAGGEQSGWRQEFSWRCSSVNEGSRPGGHDLAVGVRRGLLQAAVGCGSDRRGLAQIGDPRGVRGGLVLGLHAQQRRRMQRDQHPAAVARGAASGRARASRRPPCPSAVAPRSRRGRPAPTDRRARSRSRASAGRPRPPAAPASCGCGACRAART